MLILAVAGNVEVIRHTGAANNTRHEMEHSMLLTLHSTLRNKVCPLSIVCLGIAGTRPHIGHGTASVVCVSLH